jgi:hypothetical protein
MKEHYTTLRTAAYIVKAGGEQGIGLRHFFNCHLIGSKPIVPANADNHEEEGQEEVSA